MRIAVERLSESWQAVETSYSGCDSAVEDEGGEKGGGGQGGGSKIISPKDFIKYEATRSSCALDSS